MHKTTQTKTLTAAQQETHDKMKSMMPAHILKLEKIPFRGHISGIPPTNVIVRIPIDLKTGVIG